MKKRLFALLLALSLLSPSVLAAPDSTGNFIRAKTYAGQFSDLAEGSPFYANVSALYEYGLSIGKTDGSFGLTDPLTVGQAIIFAGRIRSLYRTGDPESGAAGYQADGQPAAMAYLLYLRSDGVLLDAALDAQLAQSATRAQMAHILANILPAEALPDIHADLIAEAYAQRRFITDVTEYTPYYWDILSLYKKGVCIGADSTGSFLPDSLISRGAAAAMLTRMIDPALRVTPNWDLTQMPAPAARTLAGLVEPGAYIASPSSAEEMDSSIRYMLSGGSNQLTLTYDALTLINAREILLCALSAAKAYCEQSYNTASCDYTPQGTMLLTFSSTSADGAQLENCRDTALAAALAVREQLWADGALTAGMTETEMAWVYYQWICENCTYDSAAGDDSISHLPYSLFQYGTAVCDGYTGAYNLLLKLEGIDCSAIHNSSHIWTSAILDGTEFHIDTTWGDAGDHASPLYFAMTPEQSYSYHPW